MLGAECFGAECFTDGAGATYAAPEPLPCSPSLAEQAGQAPQPCEARTRSATAIWALRPAWYALGA